MTDLEVVLIIKSSTGWNSRFQISSFWATTDFWLSFYWGLSSQRFNVPICAETRTSVWYENASFKTTFAFDSKLMWFKALPFSELMRKILFWALQAAKMFSHLLDHVIEQTDF